MRASAAAATVRVRGDGAPPRRWCASAAMARLRCDGVGRTPPKCGRWYGANAIDASRGETNLSLVLW